MNGGSGEIAMAALLDAVSLLRGEVAALALSNERIEAAHRDLHQRLDTIDAGQAAVTDIVPLLELVAGRINDAHNASQEAIAGVHDSVGDVRRDVAGVATLVEKLLSGASADRTQHRSDQKSTAALIAFARSAILGNHAALPVNVEDDPLLEHYVLNQPPDISSTDRALVDWRSSMAGADTAELIALLQKQQTPSPTDTPHTRILRYRLAALTRSQIEGRGVIAPAPPTTTRASDRSAATCLERSQELAELWRAGESRALFAEAELAGAVDLFAAAERRAGPPTEGGAPPELIALHRELADRIESGDRPNASETRFFASDEPPTLSSRREIDRDATID